MTKIAFLLAIPLLFGGCDKIKTVTFNSEFSVKFEVDETDTGMNIPYHEMEAINLADDPDLAPYIDDIKDIKIKSISYKIENYTGTEDITFDAEIGFAPFSATSSDVFSSTGGVLLFDKSQETTKTLLYFNPSAIDRIKNLLMADKAIRVFADGLMSHGPVKFDLKVYVFATISAETED